MLNPRRNTAGTPTPAQRPPSLGAELQLHLPRTDAQPLPPPTRLLKLGDLGLGFGQLRLHLREFVPGRFGLLL
jgi:hypothetical protein